MTAKIADQRRFKVTFTIDLDNHITTHGTPAEAAAATATPFDSFSSHQQLAELAKAWPAQRLVAIWNSLPGVKPVQGFKSAKAAASRIWERIQGLGAPEQPAKPKAKGGARVAKGAPTKAKATQRTTAAKNAPKAQKAAKAPESAGPRDGSKTAQVVAMLQRKNGATLAEIMDKMGWQRHYADVGIRPKVCTVRSFRRERRFSERAKFVGMASLGRAASAVAFQTGYRVPVIRGATTDRGGCAGSGWGARTA